MDRMWLRQQGKDCSVSICVQAGAKTTEIVGEHNGALKIRVAAQRVEGLANESLLEYLSDILKVGKKDIQIIKGEFTKYKVLLVHNISSDALAEKLQKATAGKKEKK